MLVGDLVKYVDWDTTAGFGAPIERIAIIVDIPESKCLPPIMDILLPNEIITVHSDEVEHVKD